MNNRFSTPDGHGRKVSRATKLVLIGGLASGAAFAAVTGISSAASSSGTPKVSTAAASSSTSTTTPTNKSGRPGGSGFGGPGGFGGLGGPGGSAGGGTVTAISGTTMTLRTEAGTETVDTTSSTTFTKEMQTVTRSAVQVGDVVHVLATRPSSGSSRPTPGTGTVTATRVTIVEPTLTGRVTAVNSGTLSLVGPDGKLLTVSTSGSTKYYSGTTTSSASAVKVGSYVSAEGTQDTLTHLTADVVSVRAATSGGPDGGGWGPGAGGRGPGEPGLGGPGPGGPGPWGEGPAAGA